jgi:hypothetical protein
MVSLLSLINIIKSKGGQLVLVGLLGLGIGAYIHHKVAPPTTTTQTIHDTKEVRVEVPVLTEKIVDRIIADPNQQKAIAQLLKENNDLKLKLTQVSSTVATNQSSGQVGPGANDGKITPPSTGNQGGLGTVVPSGSNEASYNFKDFQLNATYNATTFKYDLSQTFIIESTVGRDSEGANVGITRLWQQSPNGLISIPAQTTVIQAAPNPTRWFVSPRIQGGLSFDQNKTRSGFIGLQLIKRGSSKDPKDLRLSVGTIGARVESGSIQPAIIPININVGSFKWVPLSNLWVGPSIDWNKKLGLTISATF